ncbi:RimK-like protein [Vibrio hibernica]|uniref:RimK-like protein n=1 Tax=Vibrio hibernica TaxID=2587465 RepID=UPI00188107FD|nr:RimK-like protein [Vibrio hibernica]
MIVDVLIVSSIYDFSTDLVVQELENRGVNYFRLNKENFTTYRSTIDIENKLLEVRVDGEIYQVTSATKSIYYRQPVFLRNTPSNSLTIDEQLSRSQWMGFLRSLVIFENAAWLNRPEATYLAETKAYQLILAQDIGFKIPTTLIGNDADKFQRFKQKIIIKSLDTILLRESNDCLFTYSTIKDPSELNDQNVSSAPLTVQEYVTQKIDIRVTVIGNKLVAVIITSEGHGIEEDWRTINRDLVEYTEIKLPKDIENHCFELLSKLKLNFGAIDLLLSNGEFTFVEINPTGEWGWLVNSDRRFDIDIATWLTEGK